MRTADDGSAVGYCGSFPHPDGTNSTDTDGKAFTGVNQCANIQEAENLNDIMEKNIFNKIDF